MLRFVVALALAGGPALANEWMVESDGAGAVHRIWPDAATYSPGSREPGLELRCEPQGDALLVPVFASWGPGKYLTLHGAGDRVEVAVVDGAVRRSLVEPGDWGRMIAILRAGGDVEVTSSANRLAFQGAAPLRDFACP